MRKMTGRTNPLERAGKGRIIGVWYDDKSERTLIDLLGYPEQVVREGGREGLPGVLQGRTFGLRYPVYARLLNDPSAMVMLEAANIFPLVPIIQVLTDKAVEGTVLTNAIADLVELKAEEAVPVIVEILARERGAEIVFRQFPCPPLPCFTGQKKRIVKACHD